MRATIAKYPSPLGEMLLAASDGKLIGAWFMGQKRFASTIRDAELEQISTLEGESQCLKTSVLQSVAGWLDRYFSGSVVSPAELPIRLIGSEFQCRVWRELMTVPWGRTTTYGTIAKAIGSSPRAVGNAVGANPLLIIVPCHRVLPADGSLGGFTAGTHLKRSLLTIEKIILPINHG